MLYPVSSIVYNTTTGIVDFYVMDDASTELVAVSCKKTDRLFISPISEGNGTLRIFLAGFDIPYDVANYNNVVGVIEFEVTLLTSLTYSAIAPPITYDTEDIENNPEAYQARVQEVYDDLYDNVFVACCDTGGGTIVVGNVVFEATYGDLPVTGNADTLYIIEDTGDAYFWDGAAYFKVAQDVFVYANLAAFPATGQQQKLYVAIDTGIIYYWNGAAYVAISTNLNFANSNLTFTGSRTHDGAGFNLTINDVATWQDSATVSRQINVTDGATFAGQLELNNSNAYLSYSDDALGAGGVVSITSASTATTFQDATGGASVDLSHNVQIAPDPIDGELRLQTVDVQGVTATAGMPLLLQDATTGESEFGNLSPSNIGNISSDRLLGRDTAGSGTVEQITVGGGIEFTGGGGVQTSAFTGDVTKTAGGTALTIANDAVTFAKMQDISTDRLLGRDTAGSGNVEEISLASSLGFTGAGAIQVVSSPILTTARDIDGIPFDGSADIIVNNYVNIKLGLGATTKGFNWWGVPSSGNNLALTSTRCVWCAYWIDKDATITGVNWMQVTAGDYTASNYNGVGLYTYSGGTLTLVASSTDDGAIWKATGSTWQSKAFSATYSATAGLHFIAILHSRSATVTIPSITQTGATPNTALATQDFTNSAKVCGIVNGLTAFPATQAMSGVTASVTSPYLELY